MAGWRERRRQRKLEQSGFEAKVESFGTHGRGIVSGRDLTPEGMNDSAVRLFDQGRRAEAVRLWRQLAEGGDPNSMANLVIECAADGEYREALRWWRRVTDAGVPIPPHDPGLKLRATGRDRAAEGWWRAAADALKDDRSCEYLGIALRERGELEDARHWLRQGAVRGDPPCARELAAVTLLTAERSADPARQRQLAASALEWVRKAAAGGDARARLMLSQLEGEGR